MDPELDQAGDPAADPSVAPPAEPGLDDDPAMDPDGDLPPEHQYTADRYMKHFMRKYPKLKQFCMEQAEGEPEQFEAAAPGSSNVDIPAMAGADPSAPPQQFGKRSQSRTPGRDDNSIHYARELKATKDRLGRVEQELAQERQAKKQAQGDRFVTMLEGEGFNFKARRDHWVKQFANASEAERKEFVAEIRDNWQQDGAPTGTFVPTAEHSDDDAVLRFAKRQDGAKKFSKEDARKAVEMSQDGKMTYEEAVEKIKAGKAV